MIAFEAWVNWAPSECALLFGKLRPASFCRVACVFCCVWVCLVVVLRPCVRMFRCDQANGHVDKTASLATSGSASIKLTHSRLSPQRFCSIRLDSLPDLLLFESRLCMLCCLRDVYVVCVWVESEGCHVYSEGWRSVDGWCVFGLGWGCLGGGVRVWVHCSSFFHACPSDTIRKTAQTPKCPKLCPNAQTHVLRVLACVPLSTPVPVSHMRPSGLASLRISICEWRGENTVAICSNLNLCLTRLILTLNPTGLIYLNQTEWAYLTKPLWASKLKPNGLNTRMGLKRKPNERIVVRERGLASEGCRVCVSALVLCCLDVTVCLSLHLWLEA